MQKNYYLFLLIVLFCLMLPEVLVASQINQTLLPPEAQATLDKIYQQYATEKSGKNASYIPELAKVDPNLFAIAIVTVTGEVITAGNTETLFPLESISKPFTYALALKDYGEDFMFEKVGLNATGTPFNSLIAIERSPDHRQNPYVNAGAIQTTSYIKGENAEDKWHRALNFYQSLSDTLNANAPKPFLGYKVYQSESETNQRNRAIIELLKSYDLMTDDALDALDRYTKACPVMVNIKQLAIMGATLANHGMNPITRQQIIPPRYVRHVLSEMIVNGLYENSGVWFVNIGLPAKSGVSGGILAIVPNKMAIAVFSPPLDASGNSVRAQAVIKALSQHWHLHLLREQTQTLLNPVR